MAPLDIQKEETAQEKFSRLWHELYRRNAQWANFVKFYLSNGFNARQAAISAGYAESTAHNQGYRLKINDDISPVIAAGKEAMKADPDEILMRMTRRARGTIEHFVRQTEDGQLEFDMTTDVAKQNIGNIKEIKFTKIVEEKPNKHGTSVRTVNRIDLKIHDSMKADELLGKHHSLFKETIEHEDGPGRQKRSKEERAHELAKLRRLREQRKSEEE